jgi:hypothetical protein
MGADVVGEGHPGSPGSGGNLTLPGNCDELGLIPPDDAFKD